MAITRDLSDLPKATTSNVGDGLAPDAEPRFVQLLVEQWRQDDIDHPHVRGSDARFWHSDAGKCSRLIAYKAAGIPASDPMDLSGTNNVNIGTILHDAWQQAAIKRLGDRAEAEVRVFTLDGDGTGKVDLVITEERQDNGLAVDYVIDVEYKTCGGYAYKASIGKASRGRPAEGPKSEHLLQGALNGLANEADEIVISYLAKEAISVNMAKGLPELSRFACEWTFTADQYVPLAVRELERVGGILALVDEGTLAARKMIDLPPGAEIVDPKAGRWEQHATSISDNTEFELIDTGTHWSCNYCSHQTLCAQTPSGRIPIEQAVAISERGAA